MEESAIQMNSVTRLNEVMKEISQIPPESANRRHTVQQALCMAFGIDGTDPDGGIPELITYLQALRRLFQESIDLMSSVSGINQEKYVQPLRVMSGMVEKLNILGEEWGAYRHYVSNDKLIRLDYIAELSKSISPSLEKEVSRDDIGDILGDAHELYEKVLAAEIAEELKVVLLNIIQNLTQSIHLYRIRGSKALAEGVAQGVGVFIANRDLFEDGNSSGTVQELQALMRKIDVICKDVTKKRGVLEATGRDVPLLETNERPT